MRFKVKPIPISSGYPKFVVLHKKDSEKYDIHRQSRLRIKHGKQEVICIAETTYEKKQVRPGQIGILSEVQDILQLKRGSIISAQLVDKPDSISYIKKKLAGKELSKKEIHRIVRDIVRGHISDVELTYFVSGCYRNELTSREIHYLTTSLVETGQTLKPRKKPVLDKHCIGGIPGNRTTMIVVPIIAAFGLTIPKTSSRSITSPSGTADTMEVLCNVNLELEEMKQVLRKAQGCLAWGGTVNLAPADDEIIRVEYPLVIDTVGLLLSSVLAKKQAVGATHVLIDIPFGKEAKVSSKKRALELKKRFTSQAKKLGMKLKVVLTDGSKPIGRGVGPVLEANDVLKVLRNDPDCPQDLREKSILLAGQLLNLSGKTKHGAKEARKLLESGRAYLKFMEICNLQGRKIMRPVAKHHETILAEKNGTVRDVSNHGISRIARLCGAPRTPEAGLFLHKNVGDKVKKGDALLTLYARSRQLLKYAVQDYELLTPIRIGR